MNNYELYREAFLFDNELTYYIFCFCLMKYSDFGLLIKPCAIIKLKFICA